MPGSLPDADVVVATWWQTAEWVADLPANKGRKVHLVQGDERVFYQPGTENWKQCDRAWTLPLEKIVVSDWLAKQVFDRCGAWPVHVPNGVDVGHFCAPVRSKQSVPTVGTVYSAPTFKGTDICLRAFELAKLRIPALKLLVFGQNPPDPAMPLPAGSEFFLRPEQQLIPQLYARCDAWLFGSRCEGFGLPILEAMACRTPVIATPAGAAPQLLAPGGGLLVPHERPDRMCEAIFELLVGQFSYWQQASETARRTALRHEWEHSIDKMEAALLDLLGGRSLEQESESEHQIGVLPW
jgi:glycosyltransferase involved in cell wall biosynthesis